VSFNWAKQDWQVDFYAGYLNRVAFGPGVLLDTEEMCISL
jgi:hypothetical protein